TRRPSDLADEADNSLAQRITGARPRFRTAEVLHARLKRTKLKIIDTGGNQGGDLFFQKIKKRELITCAGMPRNIEQRNGNRRRRRRKVRHNFLVADRV